MLLSDKKASGKLFCHAGGPEKQSVLFAWLESYRASDLYVVMRYFLEENREHLEDSDSDRGSGPETDCGEF